MRKSKFTEEQIAMALRQHEAGTTVGEICRKLEISDTTFFRWQKHCASSSAGWASRSCASCGNSVRRTER